jgi:hypothetical protein
LRVFGRRRTKTNTATRLVVVVDERQIDTRDARTRPVEPEQRQPVLRRQQPVYRGDVLGARRVESACQPLDVRRTGRGTLRQLQERRDTPILDLSEDDVLHVLADFQRYCERTGGRTVRSDATAAGIYDFWRRGIRMNGRPSAAQLLEEPHALFTRSHLRELGL